MSKSRLDALQVPVVTVFFVGLVLIGILTFRDFGVTWDESGVHVYGGMLLDHYPPGGAWENFSTLKYYGPVPPLITAVLDRVSPSPELAYPLSHLAYYLIFVGSVFAFYKLCARQFHSWIWGLFGAALLVASPRIFSHAFVNPKDTPLMSFFIIAIYFLITYLDTRRDRWLALCGVATALAIDTRIIGIFIIPLVLVAILADLIFNEEEEPRDARGSAISLVIYGGFTIPLTVLLWPFLWTDPLGNFLESLSLMSYFTLGPQESLYMGRLIPTYETPWHYIPVWIGISTPIPYLALMIVGLKKLVPRHPITLFRERSTERFFFIYGAWLIIPVVVIIVRNAALYDEWRQVHFIYPAMLLFAIAGAHLIWRLISSLPGGRVLRAAWPAALTVMLAFVGYQMVMLHPYQGVYFNALVGGPEGAVGKYELDYWGVSYREALEHLLDTNPGTISLFVCNAPGPGTDNAEMFPPEEKARLQYVDFNNADYAVCAPRTETPMPYLPEYETVYEIEAGGAPILTIKRIPHEPQ